ncbi:MAG TPA: AAA family ATPase [Magnetospirillum sp.]|nr:AAA family ATPase [Magnetospirillum sp.]
MTPISTGPQAEVLRLLKDPATHGGLRPTRLDTHISTIFLAGDQAWKLKKAVWLPFLDFSDLESRRRACEAEVEINRRAAPELYLGAVPVTRGSDGRLRLGGEGEAVEWLVHMRRFDQRTLFSKLLSAHRVDRPRIQALTEAVWRFHQVAPLRPDKGGVAGLTWVIDTNQTSMAASPDILSGPAVARLAEHSRQWLARFAPLIEERRAAGKVRQCHGDLHCGNICELDGRPTLFDAIEFSDDIACIDVFHDLAFLLMDLQQRGARVLAGYALNHYLDLSADYQGVALLPLLLSLRAGVRAHVCATMAAHAAAHAPSRDRLAADACAYLDAALAYLAPPSPSLLAVGGLSGSGKSRMGRELAPLLAVPAAAVVRTDSLRKQMMGVGLLDKLAADGYTPEMTERTYQALYDTSLMVLKAGHSVVADAVFAKPEQRAAIEQVARAAGVPFRGMWLETRSDIAAKRIQGRKANVSDATVAVLRQQLDYDLGAITWTRVQTGGSKAKALRDGRAALGV